MLQQITVIAAQFDDEAFRSKPEPAFDRFAVAPGMRHPSRRIGREIGVFGENVRWTDELRKLNQPAGMTNSGVERVIALWRVQLVLGEEALTERRHAEDRKSGG